MSRASTYFGGNLSPSILVASAATAGGVVLQTGTVGIAAVTTTGSSLDAYLTAVADLSAPDPWTELVSVTGPALIQFNEIDIIELVVDAAEDADEGLAAKITIDGTVAFQAYVVKDATDQTIKGQYLQYYYSLSEPYPAAPMYIKSTFSIHGARKGDGFTNATTKVVIAGYKIVQLS